MKASAALLQAFRPTRLPAVDDLFSSEEQAKVQSAALLMGVSPQEFLRRAALALAAALMPDGGSPAGPPVRRGLTPLDL
jgi:hypothetical protein